MAVSLVTVFVCVCVWSSGRVLDLYHGGHRFDIQPGTTAEQVENILCTQVNSASYPQWDGK